jgi:hypothetical protein
MVWWVPQRQTRIRYRRAVADPRWCRRLADLAAYAGGLARRQGCRLLAVYVSRVPASAGMAPGGARTQASDQEPQSRALTSAGCLTSHAFLPAIWAGRATVQTRWASRDLVCLREVTGPKPDWADRAMLAALARLLPAHPLMHRLVTPRHPACLAPAPVKRKWTYPNPTGRPGTSAAVRELQTPVLPALR